MQPARSRGPSSNAKMICKSLKINGGSVCESNAPLTSKTPIAGFEDRESHRTPFASAVVTANAGTVAWVSGVRSSCRVKLGLAINQTAVPRTVAETVGVLAIRNLPASRKHLVATDFLRPCLEDR